MSEIRASTISDAAGTGPITLTGQSAAKAWFIIDGTGTVAFLNSFNLSSVTDQATGTYYGTMTSAMSGDALWAANITGTEFVARTSGSNTDSIIYAIARNNSNSPVDDAEVSGAAHGDLA